LSHFDKTRPRPTCIEVIPKIVLKYPYNTCNLGYLTRLHRLIKFMKKILIIILAVVIVAGAFVFAWQNWFLGKKANSNQQEMQNTNIKPSVLGNLALDRAVTNFLLSQQQFSWKTTEGSSNFCVFENLNPESQLFPVYIWIRCGEFKVISGELKELSGTSLPVKIDYPNELSYYDNSKFTFKAPRDGSLYDKDVKIIFPEAIWPRLHHDGSALNQRILQTAKENLLP
jgi:hypothetical protein